MSCCYFIYNSLLIINVETVVYVFSRRVSYVGNIKKIDSFIGKKKTYKTDIRVERR